MNLVHLDGYAQTFEQILDDGTALVLALACEPLSLKVSTPAFFIVFTSLSLLSARDHDGPGHALALGQQARGPAG